MQDRVPVNPGRVLVTPENGNAPYYATLTRADNPTQEGTPLNKASLLKDATAALFGLGTDAVPDDVLASLFGICNDLADADLKIFLGSYTGTGVIGQDNPNVVTLDFAPKLMVLSTGNTSTQYVNANSSYAWGYLLVSENMTKASTYGKAYYVSGGTYQWTSATNHFLFNGNTVSWYVPYDPFANLLPQPDCQLNEAGVEYSFVVFGLKE